MKTNSIGASRPSRVERTERALPAGRWKSWVFLCGASGSGKSSLLRELRLTLSDEWSFPVRYTTRPQRKDDDPRENATLSEEQFDDYVHTGKMCIWWTKTGLAGYRYGFETTPNSKRVFGANEELISQRFTNVKGIDIRPARQLCVVYLIADPRVRAARIARRNPSMTSREMKYRTRSSDNLDHVCHVLLRTDAGASPQELAVELASWLDGQDDQLENE